MLELSSAWVVFRAWGVFCLGLCGASCCGSSEMSHAIPRHVCQTLKSHCWNCSVLGCCTKFGYPNCVRVLVDEAPEASSCVRSSSHDTVHDPRDASNTTPTPQNAKSRISRGWRACRGANAHVQRFMCERHTRPGAVASTTQTTSPTTPRCRRLLPRWFATWAAPPRDAPSPTASVGNCPIRGPVRDLPAGDIATKRGELHH